MWWPGCLRRDAARVSRDRWQLTDGKDEIQNNELERRADAFSSMLCPIYDSMAVAR